MFKIVDQEKFREEFVRIVTIECPWESPRKCATGAGVQCYDCWLKYMGLEEKGD